MENLIILSCIGVFIIEIFGGLILLKRIKELENKYKYKELESVKESLERIINDLIYCRQEMLDLYEGLYKEVKHRKEIEKDLRRLKEK